MRPLKPTMSAPSPLARANDQRPEVTERFELYITGREFGNGFSELNDAEDQAERFHAQVAAKDDGDDEAMTNALLQTIRTKVSTGFGIHHMTIQMGTHCCHPDDVHCDLTKLADQHRHSTSLAHHH